MALKKSVLAGLAASLGAHAGLELPGWVIESRAKERMGALGLDADQYLALIDAPKGAAELAELVEAVRVGETRFFRHQPQIDALLEVVVPAWKAHDVKRPRIWSAGCASGEEPYTLALVLARALPAPSFTPAILATDVSAEAIEAAKRGIYSPNALEQVPAPYREGLVRDSRGVRVREEIASLVTFTRQNLATDGAERGFDLVWCRNVLIYFEPAARRKVLHKLVDALSPGGFLFLGYSETLRGVAGLSAAHHGDQTLWQKPRHTPGSTRSTTAPASRAQHAKHGPLVKPHPSEDRPSSRSPSPASHRPKLVGAASPRSPRSSPKSSGAGSLHIAVSDPGALRADLAKALAHRGLDALTIDLDAAEFLDDDVAPVLRRGCAAAEAAGIRVVLRAERSGAKRWLRRNGLLGGEA